MLWVTAVPSLAGCGERELCPQFIWQPREFIGSRQNGMVGCFYCLWKAISWRIEYLCSRWFWTRNDSLAWLGLWKRTLWHSLLEERSRHGLQTQELTVKRKIRKEEKGKGPFILTRTSGVVNPEDGNSKWPLERDILWAFQAGLTALYIEGMESSLSWMRNILKMSKALNYSIQQCLARWNISPCIPRPVPFRAIVFHKLKGMCLEKVVATRKRS